MSQTAGFLFVGSYILRWWLANFGVDFWPQETHLPVSQATTHFVEPLRADGGLDFFGALNNEMSKGVTPENNAVVLLAKVSGRKICEEAVREEFCKLIGIDDIPEDGRLITSFDEFRKLAELELSELDEDELFDAWSDRESFVLTFPWTDKQFPDFAAFLDRNEAALKLLREAAERPKVFYPQIATDPRSLVFNSSPICWETGDYCRLLTASALRRAGNGDIEKSLRDTMAVRKLCALIATDAGSGSQLYAVAMEGIAAQAEKYIAASVDAQHEIVEQYTSELRKIEKAESYFNPMSPGERAFLLQYAEQLIAGERSTWSEWKDLSDLPFVEFVNRRAVNRALLARLINIEFDRQAAVWNSRDEVAIKKLEEKADWVRSSKEFQISKRATVAFLLSSDVKAVFWARRIGSLGADMSPPYLMAEKRKIATAISSGIVFALAGYRKEHEEFPISLAELSPKYLPEVPLDPITDKEFGYHRKDDSFVLYSYWKNKIDDGGDFEDMKDLHFYSPPQTYEDFIREHSLDSSQIKRVRKRIESR